MNSVSGDIFTLSISIFLKMQTKMFLYLWISPDPGLSTVRRCLTPAWQQHTNSRKDYPKRTEYIFYGKLILL